MITFDRIHFINGSYWVRLNREIPELAAHAVAIGRCVARDNPLVALLAAAPTNSPGGIHRLSDHINHEDFARTELYSLGFRPFGVRFQLLLALRLGPELIAIGIHRAEDFNEDDCQLARHLAAHLRQALNSHLPPLARSHTETPFTNATPQPVAALTAREAEVWTWMREGKRNADIAQILGCSPHTVKRHCENIYRKLAVDNRTAASRSPIKA